MSKYVKICQKPTSRCNKIIVIIIITNKKTKKNGHGLSGHHQNFVDFDLVCIHFCVVLIYLYYYMILTTQEKVDCSFWFRARTTHCIYSV